MRCQMATTLLCAALVSIIYIQGTSGADIVSRSAETLRGDTSANLVRDKRQLIAPPAPPTPSEKDCNKTEIPLEIWLFNVREFNICLDSCNCNYLTGAQGPKGRPGDQGAMGARGIGLPGEPGKPGRQGPPGEKGFRGLTGLRGEEGDRGPKGPTGLKGYQGSQGEKGDRGDKGEKGEGGDPGEQGSQGSPGLPGGDGLPGRPGDHGRPGEKGDRGDPGVKGVKGCKGKPGPPTPCNCTLECYCDIPADDSILTTEKPAFVIARHSQSTQVPDCPANSIKLWEGYSLMYTEDDQTTSLQDLGSSSSCLKKFDPLPFKFCNIHGTCTYDKRSGASFWLSTNQSYSKHSREVENNEKYISRCSVCQMTSNVMAFHSQDTSVPACPSGWEPLWSGYSFLMATAGGLGGGQQLMSPGSCLEKQERPYVECNSHKRCHYYCNNYSYWLIDSERGRSTYTRNNDQPGTAPPTSRCQVCKHKLRPNIPTPLRDPTCDCKCIPNCDDGSCIESW